jgi:hypothetical protein
VTRGFGRVQLAKKCAVKGAGLLRMQLPPANWFAPPGRVSVSKNHSFLGIWMRQQGNPDPLEGVLSGK